MPWPFELEGPLGAAASDPFPFPFYSTDFQKSSPYLTDHRSGLSRQGLCQDPGGYLLDLDSSHADRVAGTIWRVICVEVVVVRIVVVG